MDESTVPIKRITLRSGPLTFSALEAGEGTPVFLLHGFPDLPSTWIHQISALSEAGFRVIAPTARGYEKSSQPHNKKYGQLDMGQDVIHWMNHLNIEKAHIVGHDWGSCVAQAAALLAPNRFLSLTIMAVPSARRFLEVTLRTPRQLKNSWYMGFFQLPVISEKKVQKDSFRFIDALWKSWSPSLTQAEPHLREIKKSLAQPGVTTAALSYYRQSLNIFSKAFHQYQKLLKNSFAMPTLAITGEEDGCVDHKVFSLCMQQQDFQQEMKVVSIKNAGHFMNLEQPQEINKLLLEWFQKHEP